MLALLLAFLQPLACHNVESDWIHGQDLAKAVPALAGISADARISPSPLPGQQRVFRLAELQRIARAYHAKGEPAEDVCFAWATSIPDRKDIQAAMQKTLAGRNAQIEIVESSLLGVPKGEMMFPLSGLTLVTNQAATLWRGYVQYGENRRFPVWARVMVTVKEQHLVAAQDLSAGDILDKNQLKVESYTGPVLRERYLNEPSQADGMRVRSMVRAGSPLLEDMLDAPYEVNRGDLVNAVVEIGAARLEVQAMAEASGRKGQVISLRNMRSGRTFHGRVQEKGTVLVVPGGQYGLAVETKKS